MGNPNYSLCVGIKLTCSQQKAVACQKCKAPWYVQRIRGSWGRGNPTSSLQTRSANLRIRSPSLLPPRHHYQSIITIHQSIITTIVTVITTSPPFLPRTSTYLASYLTNYLPRVARRFSFNQYSHISVSHTDRSFIENATQHRQLSSTDRGGAAYVGRHTPDITTFVRRQPPRGAGRRARGRRGANC